MEHSKSRDNRLETCNLTYNSRSRDNIIDFQYIVYKHCCVFMYHSYCWEAKVHCGIAQLSYVLRLIVIFTGSA